MSRSQFFKCLNATIPLKCTLANEYPSSNEISKKNSTVQGDCIACTALLLLRLLIFSAFSLKLLFFILNGILFLCIFLCIFYE